MKKFIIGLILGATIFGTAGYAVSYIAHPATFKVMVNGEEFTSEPPAVVIEGRTYLPLRSIGDALGVPVNWNDELRRVEVGFSKTDELDKPIKFAAKAGSYSIGRSAILDIYEANESGDVFFEVLWVGLNGFGGVAKSVSEDVADFEIVYNNSKKAKGKLILNNDKITIELSSCNLEYLDAGTYTFNYLDSISKEHTYLNSTLGEGNELHNYFKYFTKQYGNIDFKNWEYLGYTERVFGYTESSYDFYKVYTTDDQIKYYALRDETINGNKNVVVYEFSNGGTLKKVLNITVSKKYKINFGYEIDWIVDAFEIIGSDSYATYDEYGNINTVYIKDRCKFKVEIDKQAYFYKSSKDMNLSEFVKLYYDYYDKHHRSIQHNFYIDTSITQNSNTVELSSGIYFVEIVGAGNGEFFKIVVE